MSLPEYINAIKTVTYHVPAIVESLVEMGMEDVDFDVVFEFIQEWVHEEFHGDSDVVFMDDEGNEL